MTTVVRADAPVLDPAAPPPGFTVRTDRDHCDVEVSTDPLLLRGALAARRTAANYASSREGAALVVRSGAARWTIEAAAWGRMSVARRLYYRAVGYDGSRAAPARVDPSVVDADVERAQAILLAATAAPVKAAPPLSGSLRWLRVEGNRIVDEAGDTVVLRGVTRSGLESSAAGDLDPTGRRATTAAAAAGITASEIGEMVSDWRANVIRVPIDQARALAGLDLLLDVDAIVQAAAAKGAYTMLVLRSFGAARQFGRDPEGRPNRSPPLPEENTLRLWRLLAGRYRREPAVLFELLSEPHTPPASDTSFPFRRLGSETQWVARWQDWTRRLEAAIHRVHPRALVFVSGWRWGLDLGSFPVTRPAGRTLANAVYSAHVFRRRIPKPAPNPVDDFDAWFGRPTLRSAHPTFVGEWGADEPDLDWAAILEQYLRDRHRYRNGGWRGVAGWTAWSWADPPLLVQRRARQRTVNGVTVRWRTFVMDGAHHRPSAVGELVRAALRTAPLASSADFDAARPAGTRSRYLASAPNTVQRGGMVAVSGHDFTAGTAVAITVGTTSVSVMPRLTLGHLLVISNLPAAVPLGAGTLQVVRPDGVRSEPVAVTVTGGPLPAVVTLVPGAPKAAPYTLAFVSNPVVALQAGGFQADPIMASRTLFHDCVADALASLFGRAESLIAPYAADVRVVARFASAPVTAANALCHQLAFGGIMEPLRANVLAYLTAAGISADVCFAIYSSPTHTRDSAWFTSDDETSGGAAFVHDNVARNHRRGNTIPGTVALHAPTDAMTPLHEFGHAASDFLNGRVVDLSADNAPVGFEVQHKQLAAVGAFPARFARFRDTSWNTDPRSATRLRRGSAWRSYGPELVDAAQPNVMDNYYLAASISACRFDRLAQRFMRDRIEWKQGR